ncbi:MAG: hypothetical protein R3C41_01690 [Calditrichia bacterium]|nr:hypothetical protein [Calditrichota bacterium]MCB0269257.1 hypothetical protein [Calditrichota bacterium]MCB0285172.1 hypothetical protein [Calditrichota bacterium]MCB9066496.1 hypothetical protein [Calditrichia bacterium]
MEQNHLTVGSISREMLKNFTRKHRSNGRQYWDLRDDIDWQHRIVLTANNNRILSAEVYSNIFRLLMEIYIAENIDQALEFLQNIEPYDTVSHLTGWLDASPENLKYLNLSLDDDFSNNGMTLLAKAHQMYLLDLGQNLVHAIDNYIQGKLEYAAVEN